MSEKQIPVCSECGSSAIVIDAYAEWDTHAQDWSLQNTFEQAECNDCGGSCSLEWLDVDDYGERRKARDATELAAEEAAEQEHIWTQRLKAAGELYAGFARAGTWFVGCEGV